MYSSTRLGPGGGSGIRSSSSAVSRNPSGTREDPSHRGTTYYSGVSTTHSSGYSSTHLPATTSTRTASSGVGHRVNRGSPSTSSYAPRTTTTTYGTDYGAHPTSLSGMGSRSNTTSFPATHSTRFDYEYQQRKDQELYRQQREEEREQQERRQRLSARREYPEHDTYTTTGRSTPTGSSSSTSRVGSGDPFAYGGLTSSATAATTTRRNSGSTAALIPPTSRPLPSTTATTVSSNPLLEQGSSGPRTRPVISSSDRAGSDSSIGGSLGSRQSSSQYAPQKTREYVLHQPSEKEPSTYPGSPSLNALGPHSSHFRPFGLRNMGNTCYLNATLQCVLHTPTFVHRLMKQERRASPTGRKQDGIVQYLSELIEPGASTGPLLTGIKQKTSLLNAEFTGHGQNDGHEFLRSLLHAIHNEVNRSKFGKYQCLDDISGESDVDAGRRWADYHREHDDSVVYDIFGGQLKHVTRCSKCEYRSLSFDPMLDLCLALPKGGFISTPSQELPELLRNFSTCEELSGTEQFRCPRCKKPRDARRQTTVSHWPSALVIHLKRFSSSGSKNSAKVKFPKELKMPCVTAGMSDENIQATPTYYLRGIVIHSGSAHFGHYTSYVQCPLDDRWYYCDDSQVRAASVEDVLSERAGAYFLFYDR